MIKSIFARSAWTAGIACVALLAACGGGGDATPTPTPTPTPIPTETGFAAIAVPDGFKFEMPAVNETLSFSLSRTSTTAAPANVTVIVSGFTCEVKFSDSNSETLAQPIPVNEIERVIEAAVNGKQTLTANIPLGTEKVLLEVIETGSLVFSKYVNIADLRSSTGASITYGDQDDFLKDTSNTYSESCK